MVGNRPTMTNSVVPMANALRVSANRAMGMGDSARVDGAQYPGQTHAEKPLNHPNTFDSISTITRRCRQPAEDGDSDPPLLRPASIHPDEATGLVLPQPRIEPAAGDQLGVGAALDHLALVDHHQPI